MKYLKNSFLIIAICLFFGCNTKKQVKEGCHTIKTDNRPSFYGWEAFHEQMLEEINSISVDSSMIKNISGMQKIPAGVFTMGSETGFPDEMPIHEVFIDSFWIDKTEVTNRQFKKFIDATGYKTIAERNITIIDDDDSLVFEPGALVFQPVENNWWYYKAGANWKHPDGENSDITYIMEHPVVHISWYDAMAYCKWAGKRLPTEAEWEYAAKGGNTNYIFPWGNTSPEKEMKANIWQGAFPVKNNKTDGFYTTAPVASFKANSFGLFDISGNVWEWCIDKYHYTYYDQKEYDNPRGSLDSYDPQEPDLLKYVMRGGSFLCHSSYCTGYRTTARMKSTPDSAFQHVGFRCVSDI